jgi:hypothetical protein
LASSWTFKVHDDSRLSVPGPLPERLEVLRRTGWRGGYIAPHRAFARFHISAKDIVAATLLAVSLTWGWILVLPLATQFWAQVVRFWARALPLEGQVLMAPQHWGSHIHFFLPFLNRAAGPVSPEAWWITTIATIAVLGISFLLSDEHTPLIYLLRFLVILQGSSIVYFAFFAARFPHDLPSYMISMLFFGAILIGLMPTILALTYYLFDFSLPKKLTLTVLCMAYLALFVPLQYVIQVYLLQKTILLMPVLYFAFGPFLDVLVFVSLYGWGMSWKMRGRLVY